jgi:hypothetical protein
VHFEAKSLLTSLYKREKIPGAGAGFVLNQQSSDGIDVWEVGCISNYTRLHPPYGLNPNTQILKPKQIPTKNIKRK